MPERDLLLPTYRCGGGQDCTLTASAVGLLLPQVIPLALIQNLVQKHNHCASMTADRSAFRSASGSARTFLRCWGCPGDGRKVRVPRKQPAEGWREGESWEPLRASEQYPFSPSGHLPPEQVQNLGRTRARNTICGVRVSHTVLMGTTCGYLRF